MRLDKKQPFDFIKFEALAYFKHFRKKSEKYQIMNFRSS